MNIFNGKGQCFYQKYLESSSEEDLRLATDNFELAIFCIQKVKAFYTEEVPAECTSCESKVDFVCVEGWLCRRFCP